MAQKSDISARERRAKRKAAKAKKQVSPRKQRRRKVLVCAAILIMCLVFALFVGDADYHATAIGWAPVFMVVIGIILARLYLSVLKRGLSIQDGADNLFCRRGDSLAFKARFKNKTPLFFFRIEASFFISDLDGNIANEAATTLSLAPFEGYTLDFNVKFDHVGNYHAGLHHVVIYDFLRLFSAEIRNTRRQNVQVTPKLQALDSVGLVNDSQLESTRPAKSVFSDSIDYAYVREYVPGDPLKTIHWKLSARSENYLTRLFEQSTNPGVAVIMDFYAPEERPEKLMGMFDAIVETAFSVSKLALSSGFDSELCYCNKDGEMVKRLSWEEDELSEIVSDMPNLSSNEECARQGMNVFNDQLNNQYGQNNLVLCTGNLSSETISSLQNARMRKRNPILFAVVPSDLEGRELEEWCAPLLALEAAGIRYRVLRSSDELVEEQS